MGITLGSNFDVQTGLPLDSRIKVADSTARDAINSGVRYEGMLVYSVADATNFQLVGGIANGNWQELSGSGSGGGVNFIPDGTFEKDLGLWTSYIDYLTNTGVDTLGDNLDVKKTSAGGFVQAGVLSTNQKLRYMGLTPNGGMTLDTDYYTSGAISGHGTNSAWGFGVATTPGGALVNLTSSGGIGLSGFLPYQPLTGLNGNYGSVDLVLSRITSGQLSGKGSLQVVKPASNCLGQGFARDFVIDKANLGSRQTISFDYNVTSNYADGDVTVWIYDKTSNQMIQPDAFKVMKHGLPSAKATLTFQTNIASYDYRLIFHVSSVSALTWTMVADNFAVSPVVVPQAAAMTDWVSYVPTFTALGTPTGVSVESRRVGDTLQVKGRFTVSSGSASEARISLGHNGANGNVTTSAFGSIKIAGHATFTANAAVSPEILAEPSIGYLTFGQQGSANAGLTKLNGTVLATTIAFFAEVPILGWSSNTLVSDSAATRVVAMKVVGSTLPTGPTNGTGPIIFPSTPSKDTHGCYSPVTGLYVVKVPGRYVVKFKARFSCTATTGSYAAPYIAKNGGPIAIALNPVITQTAGTLGYCETETEEDFIAGDTIAPWLDTNVTGFAFNVSFSASTSFEVHMIQGPAQIQAATIVAAKYAGTTGQSMPNAAATIINFDTRIYDNTGSVTTGAAWKFVAPGPGWYSFKGYIQMSSQSYSVSTGVVLDLYKNGVDQQTRVGGVNNVSTATASPRIPFADDVYLNTGEYFDLRLSHNESSARTIETGSSFAHIAISRMSGVN